MNTLYDIWLSNKCRLPFAARSKFWGQDTYVVIVKFGPWIDENSPPKFDISGYPIGITLTKNIPNHIYLNDPSYCKHFIIPRSEKLEWLLVDDLDLTRFEKKFIHSLENYIHFGKFTLWLVKDVINRDVGYINWAIQNVEDFTLDEEALNYLLHNIQNFNPNLVSLACEKRDRIRQLIKNNEELAEINPIPEIFTNNGKMLTLQSKNWDKD